MKKFVFIVILSMMAIAASAQEKSRPLNAKVDNGETLKTRTENALAEQQREEAKETRKARNSIETVINDEVAFIQQVNKSKKENIKRIYTLTLNNIDLLKQAYPEKSSELGNVKVLYSSLYKRCTDFSVEEKDMPVYQQVSREVGNGKGENFVPTNKTELYAHAYFVNVHNDRRNLEATIKKVNDETLENYLLSITDHPYWISSIGSCRNWNEMKLTEADKGIQHSFQYKADCLLPSFVSSWLCQAN